MSIAEVHAILSQGVNDVVAESDLGNPDPPSPGQRLCRARLMLHAFHLKQS